MGGTEVFLADPVSGQRLWCFVLCLRRRWELLLHRRGFDSQKTLIPTQLSILCTSGAPGRAGRRETSPDVEAEAPTARAQRVVGLLGSEEAPSLQATPGSGA